MSSNHISTLEDLSDEILMDIFDIISLPFDIYYGFFNLNQRFNRVLSDSRLLMSLDFEESINPSKFQYHCQIMLPCMKNQLISLRLSNEQKFYEQIEIFLYYQRLNSFHALRRLTLIQIQFDQLTRIIPDILSLTKLNRLDIDMFDASGITTDDLSRLSNTLLSKLSTIQSLNLRYYREFVLSELASPSLIELTIDTYCAADIPQLLNLCSTLEKLQIKVDASPRRSPFIDLGNVQMQREFFSTIYPSSIKSFLLDMNDLYFNDIQLFLAFMPNLSRFRLEGLSYDLNLARGDLWQRLFETYLMKLRQFELASVRIWLGNNADDHDDENNENLLDNVNQSFGKQNLYWTDYWTVVQTHKLRSNHLNLTLFAKMMI